MWDNDPFGYALHPVTVLAAITTVAAWRVRVQHVQHVQHVRNEPGPVDAAGNLVAL